ncbi:hypothetical protein [Streptomyces lydicus]|uniref:hypothetical protein n=1 Tax=Streptomyces lydicus TaxID=47763 RepID=UPI0019D6BB60|nr:hypothetical protein [Streptomyces lydicus]MCZ1009404.1 hypothetical protein [Streptomyces lydicus]
MGRPAEVAVKFSVPFVGEVSGTWRPDDAERKAAWELYVELITRVSVVELGPSEGVLREALSSQYTLFHTTRDILRRYGPDVAPRSRQGDITFGSLAVTVLNAVVRPLLTRWHPALAEHEAARPPGVAPQQHEQEWEHEAELRQQLRLARHTLTDLARVLAEVAGAADLLAPTPPRIPNQAGGGLRKRRCRLARERRSPVGRGRRSSVVADSCLRPSFRPRMGTCGAGTCSGSLV